MTATSVLAGVTDPRIDLVIVLNGVFHEQQLLIIVEIVMLHAQLYFVFVFLLFENGSTKLIIFDCLSNKVLVLVDNFTCPEPEHMHKCSNNRCIYRRWLCDGEDDCRNGEDEIPENCYRMSTLYLFIFV